MALREREGRSAQLSVAEVLDGHERINKTAALFLFLLPATAGSLWIFDGDPTAARVFAAMASRSSPPCSSTT